MGSLSRKCQETFQSPGCQTRVFCGEAGQAGRAGGSPHAERGCAGPRSDAEAPGRACPRQPGVRGGAGVMWTPRAHLDASWLGGPPSMLSTCYVPGVRPGTGLSWWATLNNQILLVVAAVAPWYGRPANKRVFCRSHRCAGARPQAHEGASRRTGTVPGMARKPTEAAGGEARVAGGHLARRTGPAGQRGPARLRSSVLGMKTKFLRQNK